MRQVPSGPGVVLAHPLSTLTVTQGVVPLNLDLDRYGGAAPAGDRRFSIDRITLGTDQDPPRETIRDWFAPGQFLDLTDTERLSRPSFERMDAGLRVGGGEVVHGGALIGEQDLMATAPIEYETEIIDRHGKVVEPVARYSPDPDQLGAAVALGAVARHGVAHAGRARYYGPSGGVTVVGPGYAVAGADDLEPEGSAVSSFSAARQNLTARRRSGAAGAATLQVVGGHVLEETMR
jgi:hypothetical protein